MHIPQSSVILVKLSAVLLATVRLSYTQAWYSSVENARLERKFLHLPVEDFPHKKLGVSIVIRLHVFAAPLLVFAAILLALAVLLLVSDALAHGLAVLLHGVAAILLGSPPFYAYFRPST